MPHATYSGLDWPYIPQPRRKRSRSRPAAGEVTTPAFWIPVVAANRREDVDAALDTIAAKAWAFSAPDEFYRHYGAEHPMGKGFSGMQDHSAFTLDEKTIVEKAATVPLEVVKGMMLAGTVDDVLGQAAQWRDHGVRYFVVVNFGPMQPSVRGAMGTMAPFNRVVRGLKRL